MSKQSDVAFDKTVPVEAHPDDVWGLFEDIGAVVPLLSGATLAGEVGPGTYHGSLQVSFGPTRAEFRGEIRIDTEHAARRATISASGLDRRGRSEAVVVCVADVMSVDEASSSRVELNGSVRVTGVLARFFAGAGERIVDRFIDDLASAVQAHFASPVGSGARSGPGTAEGPRGWLQRLREVLRRWFRRGDKEPS